MSASARDGLGQRLRKAQTPAPEDVEALQQLQEQHATGLRTVANALHTHLQALRPNRPVSITARVKTVNTLLEKLRREKSRLSKVQDIAGVRIVSDFGRRRQDGVVQEVCEYFAGQVVHVDDLRDEPRFGYRAVHVIVEVDGFRVEVQSRTALQQLWADTNEHLADRWGRAIRYGGLPVGTTEAERQDRTAQLVQWQAASATLARIDDELAAAHLEAVRRAVRPGGVLERSAYVAAFQPLRDSVMRTSILPLLDALGPEVRVAAREALGLSPVTAEPEDS